MKDPALISLLNRALSSSIGIKVATNNADRLRQKLYRLRGNSHLYENLAFLIPGHDPIHSLWIVKKEISIAPAEAGLREEDTEF